MAQIGSRSLRASSKSGLKFGHKIERLQLPVVNGGEQQPSLIEPALQVGIDGGLVADLDELQPEQPDPARQKLSGELDGAALRLAQGVGAAD